MLRFGLLALLVAALIYSAQNTREGSLSIRVLDSHGKPTAARVALQDASGVRPKVGGTITISETAIPIPKQALGVLWGQSDKAQGWALQPDGSFYVEGAFEVSLPPGSYTLAVSKGHEYLDQTQTVEVKAGAKASRDFRLERWVDMPARGWYSADDHVHLQRSPRDNAAIKGWMAAEDVHVGNLLEMGDFLATYFTQYAFGEGGRYQDGDYILSPGQEDPRTEEIGHTISLGQRMFRRTQRDYYSYDRLFDQVHEAGGISGFAHQAVSFHGYRGMVLNVLRGKVDFLELVQLCVAKGPLATDHYYHFLDLGYRLSALGGSDFPWCGFEKKAQIGNARFYTYTGPGLTFEKWFQGVKAGRTFASSGPMLFFKVNGKLPGETLDVTPGTKLHIEAEALGHATQIPLSSLEVVAHGKVIATGGQGSSSRMTLSFDLPVERGMWIAARCRGDKRQAAHTTPVYVTVNGGGFRNPETAPHYLKLSEDYLQELERELAKPDQSREFLQAWRHKQELERQIAEARAKLRELAAR